MANIETIEAWFHAALEIQDSKNRLRFLESCCGQDNDLFQRLKKMVEVDSHHQEFLDDATRVHLKAVTEIPSELPSDSDLRPGTQLGPYTIIGRLGQGGMGEVFEAIQDHPIERRVALKIIRSNVQNADLIKDRFVREREVLSKLQHPNISTILDAGIDESGRLFFAMELIEGESITDYCDRQQLTIFDRVQIFEQVALAIHHAHQRGVLHLDIKPNNLMIQTVDDRPVPKVIDFGIAERTEAVISNSEQIRNGNRQIHFGLVDSANEEVLQPKSTVSEAALTEALRLGHQYIMGTPQYMSPEHVSREEGCLDVRSDVYSMGIVLYELIVGRLPWSEKVSAQTKQLDALARLGNFKCKTPLQSWETYEDGQANDLANQRGSTAGSIRKTLNGEISIIIMKCLRQKPGERYDSAAALARDLRAYLECRPLDAIEPSLKYHGSKLFQRNKTLFFTGYAVSAMVILFAIVASILASSNAKLRTLAEKRANRLSSNSEALFNSNKQLEVALLRATKAEAEMREIADSKRRTAAIERAVNRYSLLRISASKPNGLQINSKIELPRLDSGPGNNSPSTTDIGSETQMLSVLGNPITISNSSASVKTTVKPLSLSSSFDENGLSLPGYLDAVVSLFGGSTGEIEPLILDELKTEFGPTHPIYIDYRNSVLKQKN